MQVKQEADKSAAVATVVAAVDMARVREPVISAVEQTAQRTTTTAVHTQAAQERVRYAQGGQGSGCASAWGSVLLSVIGLSNPLRNRVLLKATGRPAWPRLLEPPEEKVARNIKCVQAVNITGADRVRRNAWAVCGKLKLTTVCKTSRDCSRLAGGNERRVKV